MTGLSWRIAGKSGVWPYAGIAAIRLSYRPVSMQSRRFRADIDRSGGGRLAIVSTSWQTAALMAPQDNDYRAFLAQLHARMAAAASKATLVGGLTPRIYGAALILLTLVALAMAGLLARAIAVGEYAGVLFLVGFAALFGWQIGGFVWRNRPRARPSIRSRSSAGGTVAIRPVTTGRPRFAATKRDFVDAAQSWDRNAAMCIQRHARQAIEPDEVGQLGRAVLVEFLHRGPIGQFRQHAAIHQRVGDIIGHRL